MDLDILVTDRNYVLERLKRDEFRKVAPKLRGRIVDLGCGRGQYRRFLDGAHYVGLDRHPGEAVSVRGDVLELPLRDGTVDCVLLTEVLEHTTDPLRSLREAHRVLRLNGFVYVTVPMSWCLHIEPNDYFRFTPYGVRHLASEAGFDVVRVGRIGGLLALVTSRCIDALATLFVERPLRAIGVRRGLSRIPALASAPASLLAYYSSRALDRFWDRDAVCWSFLLQKRAQVEAGR